MGGNGVYLLSFLSLALCGVFGSTAHRSVTEVRCLLSRELGWSHSYSGRFWTTGNIFFLLGVEPRLLVCPSCSPVTVHAELRRVDNCNCRRGIRFSSRPQNQLFWDIIFFLRLSKSTLAYLFSAQYPVLMSTIVRTHARTHTHTHKVARLNLN